MNGKLDAFAKECFYGFRCKMAVPGTDIHYERTLPTGNSRQGLAKLGVNGLSNHVFNNSAMRCGGGNSHKCMTEFDRFVVEVNIYLAKTSNICHFYPS